MGFYWLDIFFIKVLLNATLQKIKTYCKQILKHLFSITFQKSLLHEVWIEVEANNFQNEKTAETLIKNQGP